MAAGGKREGAGRKPGTVLTIKHNVWFSEEGERKLLYLMDKTGLNRSKVLDIIIKSFDSEIKIN